MTSDYRRERCRGDECIPKRARCQSIQDFRGKGFPRQLLSIKRLNERPRSQEKNRRNPREGGRIHLGVLYLRTGYTCHLATSRTRRRPVIYRFVKIEATNSLEFCIKETRVYICRPRRSSRKSPTGLARSLTVIARSNIAPARRYLRPTTSLETFIQCVRNSPVRRVLFLESVGLDAR